MNENPIIGNSEAENSVNENVMNENPANEAVTFESLNLLPEIQRAIEEMGFEAPTEIQAQAIPMLRSGVDVIGRSQTGTGKTMAFAIPAVEMIDRTEAEPTVQVLILCPTRELAQQGCDEIKKLIRFMLNVWPVDVYGGAPMERQIFRLKRANLVIGTPGRIMDHMRRGTISLSNVKMIVLDEADEMLSMGFREDIETILKDIPEQRQTVLFSATMPDAILELTQQYQKDPQMIQINKAQVTLDQITQQFMEVPMGRKLDALNLLLRGYDPKRCMIFCNTKLMVDEVSSYLNKNGFTCEGIHGDMNQSQRTRVMEGFKSARLPILVATDVAARGIDVNDIDYVINYDIPQNSESYVHRIGRTGRAGKEGCAITICSGRKQYFYVRDIAREVKSEIKQISIPTIAEIRAKQQAKNIARLMETIQEGVSEDAQNVISKLLEEGSDLSMIAAAAYQLAFKKDDSSLQDIVVERKTQSNGLYRKMIISIGRRNKVAPNHIVSAVAERANIKGSAIGKIEIYDDKTIVGIPSDQAEHIVKSMQGATICGIPARTRLSSEKAAPQPAPGTAGPRKESDRRESDRRRDDRRNSDNRKRDDRRDAVRRPRPTYDDQENAVEERHSASGSIVFGGRPATIDLDEPAAKKRGKVKLSDSAKARLLDGSDLERFEIKKSRPKDGERPRDDRRRDDTRRHGSYRSNDRRDGRKHDDRRDSRKSGERTGSRKNNDRDSSRKNHR
ncbi:MAG: DEAD/DEAH box helicase [Clostridia bacterium]|nr:DEAD/DEAH box helicase [Clostridia bacterium]